MVEELVNLEKVVDADEKDFVRDVFKCAANYVSEVALHESLRSLEADKEEINEADQSRHNAHESLMSSVHIANRLCDYYGIDRVYSGGSNRREYADYAFSVVEELFRNRV